jgi:hypothetical protein
MSSAHARSASPASRSDALRRLDAYWRAANYLSVGQIHLHANPLLREPLSIAHVKPRLLWRTLMGTTVLESGVPIQEGLHIYAHSLRATPGGVAVLAIDNDPAAAHTLRLPSAAVRYTLSSPSGLETRTVSLNGTGLTLGPDDALPTPVGVATPVNAS